MVSKYRPSWWDWELEFSPHLLKRMLDRGFTEVDLRAMLADELAVVPKADDPARYVVLTKHDGAPWHVIVEPDRASEVIVVVTAYAIE